MVDYETRLGKEPRREIMRGLRDSGKQVGSDELWVLKGMSNC